MQRFTIHDLAETDRRILADLELDIREAPLREWIVEVPEDFAVAGVEGAGEQRRTRSHRYRGCGGRVG